MAELTYSIDEAAAALGISDWLLRRWIEAGQVPTIRMGRRVLVSKAALAAWVETNSTTQQQHP